MRSFLHDTKMTDSEVNREDSQSVDLLRSSSSSNGNDEMDEDDETVDPALASATQSQRSSRSQSQSREEPRSSTNIRKPQAPDYSDPYDQGPRHARSAAYVTSPATQTLDALAQSQESVDLHYDLSQLEYDVVAALVQTKKIRVDPRDGDFDDPRGDPMGSRISHATSQLNKVKEKMRAASMLSASTTAATSSIKSRHRVKPARDQLILATQCSKNASTTNARNAIANGTLSKAVASSNQSLSRTTKSANNTTSNSMTARTRLLPARTTLAVPPAAEANGKRGRLPESDRRDILQISVRTGLIVRKFASFSEAGKAVGFSRHIVASILRGTYRTNEYKGWTFRFVDDENNDNQSTKIGQSCIQDCDQEDESDDDVDDGASLDMGRLSGKVESQDALDARRRKTYNRIAHIDLTSGNVIGSYPSFVVAAEHTGVSRQRISSMVKGELDAFDGSTFRYETDPEALIHAPPPLAKKEPIPDAMQSSSGGRLRNPRQTLDSMTAKPIIEQRPDVQLVRASSPAPSRVRSSKAAIAVEELDAATGKVLHTYRSLTLASEHSGANRHIISNVLKGKVESWKGKIWRYSSVTDEDEILETASEACEKRLDCKDDIRSETDPRGREKRQAQTEALGAVTKIHRVDSKIATAQPNDGNDDSIFVLSEHDSKKLRRVSDDPSDKVDNKPSLIAAEHSVGDHNRQDTTITTTSSFDECEFVTLNAVFERAGELGITVTKKQAPFSLLSFLQTVHGVKESNVGAVQMFVEEMVTPSVASKAGVQRGDYILYPKHDPIEPSITIFADYSVVVDAIRAEKRPCKFLVVRLKSCSSAIEHDSSFAKTVDQGSSSSKPDGDKTGTPSPTNSSSKGGASRSPPRNDGAKQNKESKQHGTQHEKPAARWQGDEKDEEISAQSNLTKNSTPSVFADPTIEKQSSGILTGKTNPLVVSFCLLCSGKAPKSRVQHHPWCPQNPQHESSGADDVLKAILTGIQMGCSCCNEEYERGRRNDKKKHVKGCPRRQMTNSSSAAAYKTATKKCESGIAVCKTQLTCESPSICRSNGVDGDGDDDSAYASISKNRGPYKKLVLLKPKCVVYSGANRSSKPTFEKAMSKGSTKSTARSIKLPVLPKLQQAVNVVKCVSTESVNVVALKNSVTTVPLNHVAADDDYDDWDDDWASSEKLTVVWESCGNPWGHDGHMDDDIILFSSSQRIGHHETLFTAQRYEEYPFSSHRRYRQTHLSPENGYQALVLRRDALAQRPWGFTCHHHEFGGACLVVSVDPLSPALAATLLGNGPHSKDAAPLRVNDMILAVDGRFTGGMTTVSVAIALEQAGPEVVLLVSRYMFESAQGNTTNTEEKSVLKHADALINDERILGWVDLCSGEDTKENLSLATQEPPHDVPAFVSVSTQGQIAVPTVPIPSMVQRKSSESSVGQKSGVAMENFTDHSRACLRSDDTVDVLRASASSFAPLNDVDDDSIDKKKNEASMFGCTFDKRNGVLGLAQSREIHIADSSLLNDERSAVKSSVDSDDGNAWLGCVCGEIHEPRGHHKEIFWLQCDDCLSWYDSSSHCLGFTEKQAKSRVGWSCWTCTDAREIETEPKRAASVENSIIPPAQIPCFGEDRVVRPGVLMPPSESVMSAEVSHRGGRVSISPTIEGSDNNDITLPASEFEIKPASSDVWFGSGDLVFVKEHAWPGVNNPEGIAKVLSFRFDEDGDRVYDIKYVVGGTSKGVLAGYVTRHSFE